MGHPQSNVQIITRGGERYRIPRRCFMESYDLRMIPIYEGYAHLTVQILHNLLDDHIEPMKEEVTGAPGYRWLCSVCDSANAADQLRCGQCGCAAQASGQEIEACRQHMDAKK